MRHIHSSQTSTGATQLLEARGQEDEGARSTVVSCHSIVVVLVVTVAVLACLSQQLPLKLIMDFHTADAGTLVSRGQSVQRVLSKTMATGDSHAQVTCAAAVDELVSEIEAFGGAVTEQILYVRLCSLAALLACIALVASGLMALSLAVSLQLKQLTGLDGFPLTRPSCIDMGEGDDCSTYQSGGLPVRQRSRIRELRQVQDAFCHLAIGVDRFARFVPEAVVRRIVGGETRASRLHVDHRHVTILFSDIQDFTAITEELSRRNPRDLLLMLTRYFTVMSHIVEAYEGSVGEILGDGMLAFWNTPCAVARHQAKACKAAVAMQHALRFLNAEFAMLSLPCLKIRVGINTGWVLTGNIGSFNKMKFGCLGDPMNLAARLESLCKVYGVGVICSGSTYGSLQACDGFVCRQLDVVQVKGKETPTRIFEVLGCEKSDGGADGSAAENPRLRHPASMASIREVISLAIGKLDTDWQSARCLVAATRWSEAAEPTTRSRSHLGGTAVCAAASAGAGLVRASRQASQSTGPDSPAESPLPSTTHLGGISPSRRERVIVYEGALEAFQAGRFQEARALSREVLNRAPDDLPAKRLLERAETCALSGGLSPIELAEWSGVAVMTEK